MGTKAHFRTRRPHIHILGDFTAVGQSSAPPPIPSGFGKLTPAQRSGANRYSGESEERGRVLGLG